MSFRQEAFASKEAGLVRRALEMSVKWDALCNDQIVINNNHIQDATAGDYAQLAEALGSQGKLAVNAQWASAFDSFFEANPRYAKNDANQSILEQAWVASGRNLTATDIEIAATPDVIAKLSVRQEYQDAEREQRRAAERVERERIESEQIRAKILSWLTEGPRKKMLEKNGAHPVVFQKELRDETNRLANLNHAQLVEEYNRRKEVRRIKGLSKEDFRAEVTISRAAGEQPVIQPEMQAALNQYEAIPAIYKTRHGLEVSMTRKGLIELANRDAFSFRECVRRFGAESINDILSGRRA